jgi:hypothetical protein
MSSGLSRSTTTATEKAVVTGHPPPSHGHHEPETAVKPHTEHPGTTDPSPVASSPHHEPTHKTTAHVSHSPVDSPTSEKSFNKSPAQETSKPRGGKAAHTSKEIHRSTQRRGVSDADIAAHTEYINMLLALDDIAPYWNLFAAFFTWILLAGFVLFPGTFASLKTENLTGTSAKVLNYVQEVPLYIIAWICTGIGALGMSWLWYRWHKNYVWIVNRIFIPGLLNSLAGVISTLANVYGVQGGTFSETSKSTIIVTGAIALICAVLFIVYHGILLRGLKKKHDKEVGEQIAGKHGEGINRRLSERVAKSESTDSNV